MWVREGGSCSFFLPQLCAFNVTGESSSLSERMENKVHVGFSLSQWVTTTHTVSKRLKDTAHKKEVISLCKHHVEHAQASCTAGDLLLFNSLHHNVTGSHMQWSWRGWRSLSVQQPAHSSIHHTLMDLKRERRQRGKGGREREIICCWQRTFCQIPYFLTVLDRMREQEHKSRWKGTMCLFGT